MDEEAGRASGLEAVWDALEDLADELERVCESRQTSAEQAAEIARDERDDPSDASGSQAREDQRVAAYFAGEARGLWNDLRMTEWAIATLRAAELGRPGPAMPTLTERASA